MLLVCFTAGDSFYIEQLANFICCNQKLKNVNEFVEMLCVFYSVHERKFATGFKSAGRLINFLQDTVFSLEESNLAFKATVLKLLKSLCANDSVSAEQMMAKYYDLIK